MNISLYDAAIRYKIRCEILSWLLQSHPSRIQETQYRSIGHYRRTVTVTVWPLELMDKIVFEYKKRRMIPRSIRSLRSTYQTSIVEIRRILENEGYTEKVFSFSCLPLDYYEVLARTLEERGLRREKAKKRDRVASTTPVVGQTNDEGL